METFETLCKVELTSCHRLLTVEDERRLYARRPTSREQQIFGHRGCVRSLRNEAHHLKQLTSFLPWLHAKDAVQPSDRTLALYYFHVHHKKSQNYNDTVTRVIVTATPHVTPIDLSSGLRRHGIIMTGTITLRYSISAGPAMTRCLLSWIRERCLCPDMDRVFAVPCTLPDTLKRADGNCFDVARTCAIFGARDLLRQRLAYEETVLRMCLPHIDHAQLLRTCYLTLLLQTDFNERSSTTPQIPVFPLLLDHWRCRTTGWRQTQHTLCGLWTWKADRSWICPSTTGCGVCLGCMFQSGTSQTLPAELVSRTLSFIGEERWSVASCMRKHAVARLSFALTSGMLV